MLLDYVKDYGGRSFEEVSLNTLDMLALTALCYFDFPQKCWDKKLPEALGEATHYTIHEGSYRPLFMKIDQDHDEALRSLVMTSSRYEEVIVRSFACSYEEGEHQFGALCLQLDDLLFIIFRGTDDTVTGWNEALQLSLDVALPGQLLAQAFFLVHADLTSGPIIVCGHSKGGNLAAYAATTCAVDESISARISAVLSFDGPGLPKKLRRTEPYKRIKGTFSVYIPKSSFIGNIHEHPDGSITYVDSIKTFMSQHFVYNWKTKGTHFVKCKQSLMGKVASGAMNLLIDNLNDKQKNHIFDAIFYFPKRKKEKPKKSS